VMFDFRNNYAHLSYKLPPRDKASTSRAESIAL
jgi:hypothetical protein